MDHPVLRKNEVHLWFQPLDVSIDVAKIGRLAKSEKQKFDQIASVGKKSEFLATRLLVRDTLSRYADVAPDDWIFGENEFGMPYIKLPQLAQQIRFNVSHCKGLVVCAVSLEHVGVDVELVRKFDDLGGLAEIYFSKNEIEKAKTTEKFFEIWTLKEAYIKARGLGNSISTQNFSFEVDSQGDVQFEHHADQNEKPDQWQFILKSISPNFQMALAVRSFSESVTILENWL